jgi:hypothetical protein
MYAYLLAMGLGPVLASMMTGGGGGGGGGASGGGSSNPISSWLQ